MLREVCKEAGYTDYEKAEQFNRVFDEDKTLHAGLADIVSRYEELTEPECAAETLELCRQAGLDLTMDEMRTLLRLRLKYRQRQVEAKAQHG